MKKALLLGTIIILFSCQESDFAKDREGFSSSMKKNEKSNSPSKMDNGRRLKELTKIEFEEKLIDFGDVISGDTTLTATYVIKNIGKNPLLIEYVNPDCTCSNFEFTMDTIKENERGLIKLDFNIKNKIGLNKFYATLRANTNSKFYKLTYMVNIKNNQNFN
ncbi:DUF1573 domain-containing protein [Robertkochia sediminum]|uniref:DUF1573 domain-containing protein n=1 Tax=Robertkochia sediminum TaxID=2785326 RepID=UPI001933E426|nr:DUF1573 domain-containing protein [Robertkochia sediminum]MBL7473296.1 DUF1573 domain-containing protein [Robertkochia sediminum]